MSGEERLPDGAGSPVGGETHFWNEFRIERAQEADKTLRPIGGGFDAGGEVDEKKERVVDFRFLFRQCRIDEEIREKMGGFLLRQFELDDETPIPKPGMMGGAVSEHCEVVHQRAEGLLVQSEWIGNGLADGGLSQLAEKMGDVSE